MLVDRFNESLKSIFHSFKTSYELVKAKSNFTNLQIPIPPIKEKKFIQDQKQFLGNNRSYDATSRALNKENKDHNLWTNSKGIRM